MMEQSDFCSASAIRAVCSIVDASTLKSIEQHMQNAIKSENPVVASVALVSTLHLFRTIPAQHVSNSLHFQRQVTIFDQS